MAQEPTIRGVFIKSHVRALEKERGREAVVELEKRFGAPVDFSNTETVPVRDEVRLLEMIVEILAGKKMPDKERELEAGRLHFRNFTTTPLWTVIMSVFGQNVKTLLLQSGVIAGRVFRGVEFKPQEVGDRSVKVVMKNNDYPIEHFQGFFEAWLQQSGVSGYVEAHERSDEVFEYLISWNEKHVTVESR